MGNCTINNSTQLMSCMTLNSAPAVKKMHFLEITVKV